MLFGFDLENMIYRELGTLVSLGYADYEELKEESLELGYMELHNFLVTYGESMYELMMELVPLDDIELLVWDQSVEDKAV